MARWLKRTALLVLALIVLALAVAWLLLRASLPRLDGQVAVAGLSAPVSIQRDRLGVVTIDAANETDAMRALGYVHAQERYFEMDLMRRTAAGELSELFGPIALDLDKRHRVHRMRARANAQLDAIAGDRRQQLRAYAQGVNAGLADLDAQPWPYLLLRTQPRPWAPVDSALVGDAMYFDLQDADGSRELALWKLRANLPPALYALLARDGTRWDAPIAGTVRAEAELPGPEQVDLRRLPMPRWNLEADPRSLALTPPSTPRALLLPPAGRERGVGGSPAAHEPGSLALSLTPPPAPRAVPRSAAGRERGIGWPPVAADYFPGSNNFAVAGKLTTDGRAIVADDMHLGLRAPNIWFRARVRYPDPRAPGGKVDVQGFTLPGLPAVVVGSNGHVAWAFTNSYVDTADWMRVSPCATGRTATAPCTPVERHREAIRVAGKPDAIVEVDDTAWGPILEREADGSALALRWTAHLPGALDFGLADLAHAGDLDAALRIADHAAIPTQNMLLADGRGRIAWRLLGPLPQRARGCSAQALVEGTKQPAAGNAPPAATAAAGATALQASPVAACAPWRISTAAAPMDIDPASGRLWTANARVVDGATLMRVGDGGYDLGARARQIRDGLFARQSFSERDLFAIQLDDRALFLRRWWELLRGEAARARSPALSSLADASKAWQGRAVADSSSYRIVRAWRLAVIARLKDGLAAPALVVLGKDFELPNLPQFEGVAWPLLQQRPAHLLPPRYDSWDALMEDAAREVRDGLSAQGPLADRTWGERNTARICHPLAAAIPLIGKRLLCMPPDPLDGDSNMPRVTAPGFGASERMVVSPGHEVDGIIHMPGGQSGHPLSPFWGAGHEDWVHGRATRFLPGETEHQLSLTP